MRTSPCSSGSRTRRMAHELSIVIMAVPEREVLVDALLQRLPRAQVVWDGPKGQREGIWPTARKGWELPMGDATHRLLLQDDAVLCPGFLEAMHEALEAVPDKAISPFVTGRGLRTAMRSGYRWATVTGLCWGVAHCLPAEQVAGFLEATLDHFFWPPALDPDDDDGRLRKWHLSRGEAVWCPLPSLVGHGQGETQQNGGLGGTMQAIALNAGPPFGLEDTTRVWPLSEDDARRWWEE